MRRTAPRRLGLALAGVSERLAPATTLAQVQARWPETVGAAIAAEAEPVSERDGLVTVACRSAVWAQELDLLGPEVVMRLNESLSGGGRGGPVRGLRAVVADPRRGPRGRCRTPIPRVLQNCFLNVAKVLDLRVFCNA